MLYTLLIKGYEVVGVDYAKTAFSRCQAYIEQNGLTMKSYTSDIQSFDWQEEQYSLIIFFECSQYFLG
ncbi:class I SAM-dependent methyltransferase [Alkalihalobacillus pseudalcaliphilus]|uniref:class I SAM-dependent methyltransferase n=1 Tax=Alkalihalobacillus pseudalcaliphilus TaxID=79884 RepID=UPI00064D73DA|nr:class I SAM-dependent methyltransferase [Alkalihalobacillus pseudalcaliphilus]KMK75862.1 hypothetical protein AB990_11405 [Alkalihalobacillus pseudalcaliphilus]